MKIKDSLEKKLQDYCLVEPPYEFDFRLEDNTVKTRNTRFMISVACAALVLVCAATFAAGLGKNTLQDTTAENYGFVVNAYAQGATEDSAEIVYSEKTRINKENPLITKCYSKSSRALAIDHIVFEICGEDILNYDINAQNGTVHFHDDLYRLSEKNVNDGGTAFDYYVFGNELYDLPSASKDTFLFWLPSTDKLEADAPTFEEQCEILNSAQDYNKYFADTLNVNIYYKDGSTQTVSINISFDSDAYAYAEISEIKDGIKIH